MIYIVMGSAGEYDDAREWAVIAYQNEAMAQQHMIAAQQEAQRINRELRELTGAYEVWEEERRKKAALLESNIYDPTMQDGYPSASYFICEVELATALPNPESPRDTPHS